MLRRDGSCPRDPACHRARVGFTLVEVMVALVVGALVLLGARAMLEALGGDAQTVARVAAQADREANGVRLLRELAGRLEVGTDQSGPFAGGPLATTFTSWCDVPAGWQERCRVTLRLERTPRGVGLVAAIDGARPVLLLDGYHTGALRYLASAAHGGQWFQTWGEGITAPIAIGIILDADTTLVPIGARG